MIGPHILRPTPAALGWAARAPLVKVVGDGTWRVADVFEQTRADAVRIYRHWWPEERQRELMLKPFGYKRAVAEIMEGLGDAADSVNYVELLNETGQRLGQGLEPHVRFIRAATRLLHAYGLATAAFGFSWGGYEWDDLSYAAYKNWGGADALSVHQYWQTSTLEYGYQRIADAAAAAHARIPPLILTEVGRGDLQNPAFGWRAAGLAPEEYAAELRKFSANLDLNPYVIGGAVFTAGATSDWESFDVDPLVTLL